MPDGPGRPKLLPLLREPVFSTRGVRRCAGLAGTPAEPLPLRCLCVAELCKSLYLSTSEASFEAMRDERSESSVASCELLRARLAMRDNQLLSRESEGCGLPAESLESHFV